MSKLLSILKTAVRLSPRIIFYSIVTEAPDIYKFRNQRYKKTQTKTNCSFALKSLITQMVA